MALATAAAAAKLLSAVQRILVARWLGAEGLGIFELAAPAFGAALSLFTLGLPIGLAALAASALGRGDEEAAEALRRVAHRTLVPLAIMGAAAFWVAAPWIAHAVGDPRTEGPLRVLAPAVAATVLLADARAWLQGSGRLERHAASQTADQLVRLLATAALAWATASSGPRRAATAIAWAPLGGALAGLLVCGGRRDGSGGDGEPPRGKGPGATGDRPKDAAGGVGSGRTGGAATEHRAPRAGPRNEPPWWLEPQERGRGRADRTRGRGHAPVKAARAQRAAERRGTGAAGEPDRAPGARARGGGKPKGGSHDRASAPDTPRGPAGPDAPAGPGTPAGPGEGTGLHALLRVGLPNWTAGLVVAAATTVNAVLVPFGLRLRGLSMEQATARFGELHGMAFPLAAAPGVLLAALATALLPAAAAAWGRQDTQRAEARARSAYFWSVAVALPCAAGTWALATPLCSLLYGDAAAAPPLRVLAWLPVALGLSQTAAAVLNAVGRPAACLPGIVVGACTQLTLDLALVPPFGIVGAAWAAILGSVGCMALNLKAAARFSGTRLPVREMLSGPGAATLAMLAAASWMHPWLRTGGWDAAAALLASVALGGAVYGAALLLAVGTRALPRL